MYTSPRNAAHAYANIGLETGVAAGINALGKEAELEGRKARAFPLRFADGAVFHTDRRQTPLLTMEAPVAFGFLRRQPAAIRLEGSPLRVSQGQSLSIVGGDITVTRDPSPTALGPRC